MHAVRLVKIAQYIAIFPAFWLVALYLIPPFPPAPLGGSYWGMLAEYSVEKCGLDCFFRSKNVILGGLFGQKMWVILLFLYIHTAYLSPLF